MAVKGSTGPILAILGLIANKARATPRGAPPPRGRNTAMPDAPDVGVVVEGGDLQLRAGRGLRRPVAAVGGVRIAFEQRPDMVRAAFGVVGAPSPAGSEREEGKSSCASLAREVETGRRSGRRDHAGGCAVAVIL